jgi:transcriptional regulator with XRE-family HTH domain
MLFMAKKNIIIERGIRLRNLREKAGLSRAQFSQQTGMSANTLRALELGDRELSSQKARLLSHLFSTLFSVSLGEDVHKASFDFLFYGEEQQNPEKEKLTNSHDDGRIQNDLHFFTTNSAYTILKIMDDLMSPFYNKGDIVGGRKIISKGQFPNYQGRICIIETLEGDKILRKVIKCDNKKITSCILNTNMRQNANIIEEIEAHSIAQAIWHWHLSELACSSQ